MIGQDLEKQIEIHNMRKQMYITEKEYLLKKMFRGPDGYKTIDYSGMPHGSGGEYPLNVDWQDLQRLQHMIDLETWAIESLTAQIKGIDLKISELKGLDAKVTYMRDFKGMALQEIADLTGYQLNHIKKISARNPR